jgi:hypothetical protein
MDCLRSFNFTLANQSNYTIPQGFKYWQIGTQHFWLLSITPGVAPQYRIVGFKNINIFKIEINGEVYSAALPVGVSAIVQNWNFGLEIVGQNSTSVGTVPISAPFGLVEQPNNPILILSKFQKSICFESPIQSAKEINIKNFYCDGIANESILSAQIGYVMNVTVSYKYEGE